MFSTKENGYISLTSVWAFSQFNFNISAYPSLCFSFLGLSLVCLLLCQSESSVSLPYSYSVLLGISFLASSLGLTAPFSPAFPPFSLLLSLSYWEFSFLPFPSAVSQQHSLEQSRCQILTAASPLCRRWLHTNGQTLLCHHLVLQPQFLPRTRCSSWHACTPAISCLSSSAKLCMAEMVPAVKMSPLLRSVCPEGPRHWPLEHCLKIINNAGWHANLELANQG